MHACRSTLEDPTNRRFIEIDPATGRIKVGATLADNAPLPGDMAFDRARHIMLGSYKSILHIDYAAGKIAPAHFLPAFGKELSPIYRSYLRPMRHLMNELNLTYLYTQIVVDRSRVIYGIDATQGDNRSPLHSEDKIPDEEIAGVQELQRSGALYHAPVTKWEQWGLIKGTFAPIFDGTGKAVAMAGADVEVSLIEQQTRQALLELLTVGVGSLLLAAGVAIVIARRIRRPLALIKTTALDVAAGNYARRIQIESPREAQALASAFNQMAASLEANMQALRSSIQELLRNRDRYELGRRLGQPYELTDKLSHLAGVKVQWRDTTRAAMSASGAVQRGDRIVIWFAVSPADGLAAARARADLALRVSARLEAAGDDEAVVPVPGQTAAPFLLAAVQPVRSSLPAGVRAIALVGIDTRHVRVLTGGSLEIDDREAGRLRLADSDVTIEFSGFTFELQPV